MCVYTIFSDLWECPVAGLREAVSDDDRVDDGVDDPVPEAETADVPQVLEEGHGEEGDAAQHHVRTGVDLAQGKRA